MVLCAGLMNPLMKSLLVSLNGVDMPQSLYEVEPLLLKREVVFRVWGPSLSDPGKCLLRNLKFGTISTMSLPIYDGTSYIIHSMYDV